MEDTETHSSLYYEVKSELSDEIFDFVSCQGVNSGI